MLISRRTTRRPTDTHTILIDKLKVPRPAVNESE